MKKKYEPRSPLVGMARSECAVCTGSGLDGDDNCSCTLRGVFRACLNHAMFCRYGRSLVKPISLETMTGRPKGRPVERGAHERFIADVWVAAKRTLTDPTDWFIFDRHFWNDWDWKLCCPRLGLSRHNFFYACKRIAERLGRVFIDRGLFPISDYHTRCVGFKVLVSPTQPHPNGIPLRAPLRALDQEPEIPPAPASTPRPVLVPVATPVAAVAQDPAAVARELFNAGRTLETVARILTGRYSGPDGTRRARGIVDVRRVLLDAPKLTRQEIARRAAEARWAKAARRLQKAA